MKSKLHPTFSSRQSAFTAFGAVLVAAITVFTTTARAPAQTGWGNALSFDGTNDMVLAGDIPLANSSFTVEAWVQRDSSDTMDMVVSQSQGTGSYNQCLMFGFHYYAGNQFVFDFYGNEVGSGTADTDTAWHHWAGTYDAVTKLRCLYRNGVLIASNTNSAEHYQGSGPIKIGVGPGGEAPNEFDGQIDEVRIWNVARSADQIRQHLSHRLMGSESNLVAYWNFDEGAGTTAHDSTTNDYDGTLNGPHWTPSTIPPWSALWFDGTNDYVVAGAVPLANSSFTIEAWARRDSSDFSSIHMLVGQGAGATDLGLHFGFHHGSSFVLGFYNDDLWSAPGYTNSDWHHWAGTYDAGTRLRCLYRDGTLIASNTALANYQGSGSLTIGTGLGNNFHGSIDDVRIWNVARSADQIRQHLSHRLMGSESNLVAYWNFDEGAGTTAHDSTTNGYDGTLFNGPQWIPPSVPTAPVFTVCRVDGPGQLRLQATGSAGLTYTLQISTNLMDWVNDTNLVASPGGLIEFVDEMDASACFYRLKWQ